MIPYGIIIKQNRAALQQSLMLWQRKYGILSAGKFIASSIPVLSVFAVIYAAVTVFFEKEFSVISLFSGILMNMLLIAFLMYLTATKTVREYALSAKEENIQLVLKEEALEITTPFSKEVIPYREIELCYEKNFLLTIITDKSAFPHSISKMSFVMGDYDTFTSLLRGKLQEKYQKRGDN